MPVATFPPRVVNEINENVIDTLDDRLFPSTDATHGVAACRTTCVSGMTFRCDGSTFLGSSA
jgi:hypothetical protein